MSGQVQWLVRFNLNKTEILLFSKWLNIQHHPTLFFSDVPIQEVVSHKHLRVNLSQRSDLIKEKAWSQMNSGNAKSHHRSKIS